MTYKTSAATVCWPSASAYIECSGTPTPFPLQPPDTSMRFVPCLISIVLHSVSGFVTDPSISIGDNGTDYDNVLSITALTGLGAAGQLTRKVTLPNNFASVLNPGTTMYVKITTPAVASSYIIVPQVIGYYYQSVYL